MDIAAEQSYPTPFVNSTLLPMLLLSLTRQKHTPETAKTIKKEYDFIVVGAGSAGSVVASRLSEIPCVSVLLLEAGKPPPLLTEIPSITRSFKFSDIDWTYLTAPQKYTGYGLINNRVIWASGKTIGGSSVLNNNIVARGNQKNYDQWEAKGAKGWSYKDVLPYFIQLEDNRDPEYAINGFHGVGGPQTVHRPRYQAEYRDPIFETAEALGYNIVDPSAHKQTGFYDVQGNLRAGQVCSTAKGYLVPAENRTNLDILANAMVRKVLIKNHQAIGVEFDFQNTTYVVKARREVIMSAGTVNTAQLLMLSGIGPRKELQRFKIPVIADLPVGKNLQDHAASMSFFQLNRTIPPVLTKIANPDNIVRYIENRTGPLAATEFISVSAFLPNKRILHAKDSPDYQIYFTEVQNEVIAELGLRPEVFDQLLGPYEGRSYYGCISSLLNPRSRGTVTLRSCDPYDPPVIDPNYYEDPKDALDVVEGLKTCKRIGTHPIMQKVGSAPLGTFFPGCEEYSGTDDLYFRCQVKQFVITLGHSVGTARMGHPEDPKTVVDPYLRVLNIKGLRVVDASVMPVIPSGNPNIPTIMIAEKASDIIKSTIKCHHKHGPQSPEEGISPIEEWEYYNTQPGSKSEKENEEDSHNKNSKWRKKSDYNPGKKSHKKKHHTDDEEVLIWSEEPKYYPLIAESSSNRESYLKPNLENARSNYENAQWDKELNHRPAQTSPNLHDEEHLEEQDYLWQEKPSHYPTKSEAASNDKQSPLCKKKDNNQRLYEPKYRPHGHSDSHGKYGKKWDEVVPPHHPKEDHGYETPKHLHPSAHYDKRENIPKDHAKHLYESKYKPKYRPQHGHSDSHEIKRDQELHPHHSKEDDYKTHELLNANSNYDRPGKTDHVKHLYEPNYKPKYQPHEQLDSHQKYEQAWDRDVHPLYPNKDDSEMPESFHPNANYRKEKKINEPKYKPKYQPHEQLDSHQKYEQTWDRDVHPHYPNKDDSEMPESFHPNANYGNEKKIDEPKYKPKYQPHGHLDSHEKNRKTWNREIHPHHPKEGDDYEMMEHFPPSVNFGKQKETDEPKYKPKYQPHGHLDSHEKNRKTWDREIPPDHPKEGDDYEMMEHFPPSVNFGKQKEIDEPKYQPKYQPHGYSGSQQKSGKQWDQEVRPHHSKERDDHEKPELLHTNENYDQKKTDEPKNKPMYQPHGYSDSHEENGKKWYEEIHPHNSGKVHDYETFENLSPNPNCNKREKTRGSNAPSKELHGKNYLISKLHENKFKEDKHVKNVLKGTSQSKKNKKSKPFVVKENPWEEYTGMKSRLSYPENPLLFSQKIYEHPLTEIQNFQLAYPEIFQTQRLSYPQMMLMIPRRRMKRSIWLSERQTSKPYAKREDISKRWDEERHWIKVVPWNKEIPNVIPWNRELLELTPTSNSSQTSASAMGTMLPGGQQTPGSASPNMMVSGMAGPGMTAPGMTAPGMSAPGMSAPGMAAPGMSAPGMAAPGMSAPGMAAPGMSAPGMAAPGMSAPGMAAPGMSAPGMAAPGMSAPGMAAPGMSAPGMAAPGMSAPGMATPGMSAPGMAAPGMSAPGMAAPGMSAPGMAAQGQATNPQQSQVTGTSVPASQTPPRTEMPEIIYTSNSGWNRWDAYPHKIRPWNKEIPNVIPWNQEILEPAFLPAANGPQSEIPQLKRKFPRSNRNQNGYTLYKPVTIQRKRMRRSAWLSERQTSKPYAQRKNINKRWDEGKHWLKVVPWNKEVPNVIPWNREILEITPTSSTSNNSQTSASGMGTMLPVGQQASGSASPNMMASGMTAPGMSTPNMIPQGQATNSQQSQIVGTSVPASQTPPRTEMPEVVYTSNSGWNKWDAYPHKIRPWNKEIPNVVPWNQEILGPAFLSADNRTQSVTPQLNRRFSRSTRNINHNE